MSKTSIYLSLLLLIVLGVSSHASEKLYHDAEAIRKANAAVAKEALVAQRDPLRPSYHLMVPVSKQPALRYQQRSEAVQKCGRSVPGNRATAFGALRQMVSGGEGEVGPDPLYGDWHGTWNSALFVCQGLGHHSGNLHFQSGGEFLEEGKKEEVVEPALCMWWWNVNVKYEYD